MKSVGLWTTDACGGLLLRLGYWHSDPAAAISTLKLTLGHIVILLVKPLLMKKLRKSTSASEPENVPPTPPRRSMAMAKQPRKFLALLNSQRIDPINEIFLVQRSHAGPHALIHCQVKAFTTNCNIVYVKTLSVSLPQKNTQIEGYLVTSVTTQSALNAVSCSLLSQLLMSKSVLIASRWPPERNQNWINSMTTSFPKVPLVVLFECRENILTNLDRFMYLSVLEPEATS